MSPGLKRLSLKLGNLRPRDRALLKTSVVYRPGWMCGTGGRRALPFLCCLAGFLPYFAPPPLGKASPPPRRELDEGESLGRRQVPQAVEISPALEILGYGSSFVI
jgi:hypothetical protein